MEEKLYSYREASKKVGLHFSVLQRYAKAGKLKITKKTVEVPGITESELKRFAKAKKQEDDKRKSLHETIIKEYRAGGTSLSKLAKKYDVSNSWVSLLINGKTKDRRA